MFDSITALLSGGTQKLDINLLQSELSKCREGLGRLADLAASTEVEPTILIVDWHACCTKEQSRRIQGNDVAIASTMSMAGLMKANAFSQIIVDLSSTGSSNELAAMLTGREIRQCAAAFRKLRKLFEYDRTSQGLKIALSKYLEEFENRFINRDVAMQPDLDDSLDAFKVLTRSNIANRPMPCPSGSTVPISNQSCTQNSPFSIILHPPNSHSIPTLMLLHHRL